ncbi:MAG: hypothetical protein ACE5EO_07700 [Candidatus Krumholzibacteriia bacterium]
MSLSNARVAPTLEWKGTEMLKKTILWLAISALLVYLPIRFHLPTQVHADTPLAVLVSCLGDVTVVRSSGGAVRGIFGLPLSTGDEVRTGDASQAEILFHNDNLIQIGANSSTRVMGPKKIAPDAAATPVGEKSFQIVQNFLKLKDSDGTSSLAQLRSADADADVRPLSPCQTRVQSDRPEFRWLASDPSDELQITVYSDEGVQWESDVTGKTEISYKDSAPALRAGITYWWTLKSTDPLRFPPVATNAVPFEVLAEADANALGVALAGIEKDQSRPSSYHFLRASVFFNYGLMEAAIQETIQALEVDAENPTLHSILAHLYQETGRNEEALGAYDRLLEKR